MAECRPGARRIQDELEHIVVAESREVLKKERMGACQRDTGASLKELSIAKAENSLGKRINNVELDHNPKHTINMQVHNDINKRINK